jgi:hypothetical protein
MASKFLEHQLKEFAINLWAHFHIRMNPCKLGLIIKYEWSFFYGLTLRKRGRGCTRAKTIVML